MTEVVGILSVLLSLLQLAHSWPCKQGSVMFRGQCETIYSVHCPPGQRLFRTLKDEEAFCDCDVFGGWYRRAEGECFQNMAPAGDLCHEENKILNVTLLSAHNITGPSNISITDLFNITELSGLNITGLLGLNITDLSTLNITDISALNFTDPADLYVLNVTSLFATYQQTFECIDNPCGQDLSILPHSSDWNWNDEDGTCYTVKKDKDLQNGTNCELLPRKEDYEENYENSEKDYEENYEENYEEDYNENYDYAGSSVKDPDYYPRDVLVACCQNRTNTNCLGSTLAQETSGGIMGARSAKCPKGEIWNPFLQRCIPRWG